MEGQGREGVDPRESPTPKGTEELVVELSGSPPAFPLALSACRFSGRLVVGSWYGARESAAFDTAFHRSRIRILSSQVSTIDPSLTGRWTRARRSEAAWEAIGFARPSRWITHRVPFESAGDAYRLIAGSPERTIQVMLVHGNAGTPPPAR